MNCVFPSELSDQQLLAYLDGDVNNDTKSHLKQCSYCRARAREFARLQNRLVSGLYRLTCPSSLELGEFHLRMLPANQALIVAQHLRECPHCTAEISQLEGYLSDLAPRTSWPGKVKALIAQWVNGGGRALESGESTMTPALTGLRGGPDGPFIYQANHVQIAIDIRDDTEQPGCKVLLGLVTGLETKGFTIQARLAGEVVATASVDEIGNFVIPLLVPGIYKLTLIGADIEIQIQSLPV